MFVVIFEVQPKRERWDDYLETARTLRPELEAIDGFVDNERFKSERTEGRVLSLSTWRDEKSLIRWRTQATHHVHGQQRGRTEIFADYHLRVGEVFADTADPALGTVKGQRFDVTDVGVAGIVAIVEVDASATISAALEPLPNATAGLVDQERFASITSEGKRLLLTSWANDSAADLTLGSPTAADLSLPSVAATEGVSLRQRRIRIIRDYGMRDRREAPQYFPDVL